MNATTRILAKLSYGVFGAACLVFGAIVVLIDTGLVPGFRAALLDEARGDLNTLHILQEFGTVLVMVGLLEFWFVRHYEQSRFFHWALTIHLALLAFVHWFDVRGPITSVASPLVTTVPFAWFLVIGLLRVATEGGAAPRADREGHPRGAVPVVCLLLALSGPARADNRAAEEKAASALRELGGKVQVEDGRVVGVDLNGDKVSGDIDDGSLRHLEKLPHLRSLALGHPRYGDKITDAGLARLAGLTELTSLHLSYLHSATDAGLAHLKGLSRLEDLAVTHTRSMTGAGLVHVRGLRRLRSLDFNHTPITDGSLANLKDFNGLKSLGLRATKVTGAGIKHLTGLKDLERLNLWETKVTDAGLADVAKLPRIKYLGLVGMPITAAGLKVLTDMPALASLEIRHVQGGDDAVLEHVGNLTHLKRLEFAGMKATEDGLKHLGKLTSLEVLLLVSSHFPDAGLAHLKGLTGLKELNLWKVPLTDDGLEHLKGFTVLEKLYLSESKVTDAGLVHLKGLTNLTVLGLSDTRVTDTGLERLTGLTTLRHVSLLHAPVSDAGVKKLKAALPNLDVYYR